MPLQLGEIAAERIELGRELVRRGLELADLDVRRLELEEEDELFAQGRTFRLPFDEFSVWAHLGSNQGPTGYEPAALTV